MGNIIVLAIKVLLAGVLGYWLYLDSKGRDYAWMFWTFMPALLIITSPIIGIPAVIALAVIYFMIRPQGQMAPCPHCHKKVIDNLFVCPFCQKNAKKECLSCHEPVPWEAEQCPHCKSRAITKS